MIKQLIKALIAGGTGVAIFYLAMTLGRFVGASPWLSATVTMSIVFLVAAASQFREHDNNDRIRGLLLTIGLVCLSAAGIFNEYARHLFVPSPLHLVLALSPGITFAVYRALLEKRSNKFTEEIEEEDQVGGKD